MGNVPPPFSPQGYRQPKSNTGLYVWVVLGILGLVVAVCGGLAFALFKGATGLAGMVGEIAECPMTMEMATSAAKDYAADHNGQLPAAATWQTDIAPYYNKLRDKLVKETEKVKMLKLVPLPIEEPLVCRMGEPTTGIAYNSTLSGKKIAEILDKSATVVFYETPKSSMNAAAPYNGAPKEEKPKFMGDPRDWLAQHLEGDKGITDEIGKKNNIDIKVGGKSISTDSKDSDGVHIDLGPGNLKIDTSSDSAPAAGK